MKTDMVYHDKLVSITGGEVIFEHYYFPTGKKKIVRLADIERILDFLLLVFRKISQGLCQGKHILRSGIIGYRVSAG